MIDWADITATTLRTREGHGHYAPLLATTAAVIAAVRAVKPWEVEMIPVWCPDPQPGYVEAGYWTHRAKTLQERQIDAVERAIRAHTVYF
jgi:hypothetical protein